MNEEGKAIEDMRREVRARLMIEMGKDAFEKMQEDIKILAEHDLNYFTSDLHECVYILTKVGGGFTDEEMKKYMEIKEKIKAFDEFYGKPCVHRQLIDEIYRCDLSDDWCRSDKCPKEMEARAHN